MRQSASQPQKSQSGNLLRLLEGADFVGVHHGCTFGKQWHSEQPQN